MRTRRLVLAAVAIAVVFAAAAPFLAARLGSPKYRVDYLALLDETARVSDPASDAWPLYQRLLERAGVPEQDLSESNRELLPVLLEVAQRPTLGMPYDPQRYHESWVAYFRARGDEARAREHEDRAAQQRSRRCHVYGAKIPSLLVLRGLARLACAAARESESRGEFEGALEYVDAAHALGRHEMRRGQVIERAIGLELTEIAHEEADRLLLAHPEAWPPDRLRAIAASPLCSVELPAVRAFFDDEWLVVSDVVQSVFTDDGNGDGALLPGQAQVVLPDFDGVPWSGSCAGHFDLSLRWARLSRWVLHAGRRETVEKLSRLWELSIAAAEDPKRAPEVERFLEGLGEVRHALVRRMDPAGLRSLGSTLRVAAVRRNLTAANVATLRYRAERGAWPRSDQDLVPAYLPALPPDVAPGSTLGFEPAEGDRPPRWRSVELDRGGS
jgi:hypothetical protein